MSNTAFRIYMASIIAYVFMGVVCFGPATVQSERAQDENHAKCQAAHTGDDAATRLCKAMGPRMTDGAMKAMLWPFWLSYMAAKD